MSSIDVLANDNNHADAIIRVCSYHRRDFDLVVVRSRPHEMQSVQASLQIAFKTLPTAELGILDRLPAELILMVLRQLDIRAFFHFRQVNRRARLLLTGLREYKLVSKHGLEGLRGLLRAELAHCFTIDDLYRSLVTDKCSTCGAFGGFLFLFTAERCCFDCLQFSAHHRVRSLSTFAKFLHISPGRLKRLLGLSLRTVPGIYNMMETPAKRPNHLIFEEKATQMLLAISVVKEDAARNLRRRREISDQRFMAATAYPCYSVKNAKIERGVSCKGCQVRLELLHGGLGDRDQTFSTQGFLSHFSRCLEAQHLWAESERGTRPVNEPEFTRRCGYFKQLGSDGLPAWQHTWEYKFSFSGWPPWRTKCMYASLPTAPTRPRLSTGTKEQLECSPSPKFVITISGRKVPAGSPWRRIIHSVKEIAFSCPSLFIHTDGISESRQHFRRS